MNPATPPAEIDQCEVKVLSQNDNLKDILDDVLETLTEHSSVDQALDQPSALFKPSTIVSGATITNVVISGAEKCPCKHQIRCQKYANSSQKCLPYSVGATWQRQVSF